MYFVTFIYLWTQWSSAEMPPGGFGVANMQAVVVFSFFSIFTWVNYKYFNFNSGGHCIKLFPIFGQLLKAFCAFLAYKRFQIGAGDEFTSAFENDPANVVHQQAYTSYSMDNENDQYNASPFAAQQSTGY